MRYSSLKDYCTSNLAGLALENGIVESINKIVSAQSVTKGEIQWAASIFEEIAEQETTNDDVLRMMAGITSISNQPIEFLCLSSVQSLCLTVLDLWENFSVGKDDYDCDDHDDEAQKLHALYDDETILRLSNLVAKCCENDIEIRDTVLPVWIKALEKMTESCNDDWGEEICREIRAVVGPLASIFQPGKETLPWHTKFSALILLKYLLMEGNQKDDATVLLNHNMVKRLGKVFFTDQEDVEAIVVSDNFVTFCSQLAGLIEGPGAKRNVLLDPKLLDCVLVNIPKFMNKALEENPDNSQYEWTSYNGCNIIMAIIKCEKLSESMLLKVLDIKGIECMVKCVATLTAQFHIRRISSILQSFVFFIKHTSSSDTLTSKAIKSIAPVFSYLAERFMDAEYSPNRGGMFRNLYNLAMSLLHEVSTAVNSILENDGDADIVKTLQLIDNSGIIETISHVVTTCNSTEEDSIKEATKKALMPFVCKSDENRGRDLVIRLAKCLPSLVGRLDTDQGYGDLVMAYALAFARDEIIEVYQRKGKIAHFKEMATWLSSGSVDLIIPFYLRAMWNLANSDNKEIASSFPRNLEAVIDTLKHVFEESELYKLDTLRQLARLSGDILSEDQGTAGLRVACKKLVLDNPDKVIVGFLSVALLS